MRRRTVRLEQLAPLSWPGLKLPDGRRVLFVPEAKSVGILLPHAWNDLRHFAKASRGPLICHAYAVTLGVLQYWKVRGPKMVQRRKDRKAWIDGGKNQWEFDRAADPKGRDEKIETWMYHWARQTPQAFQTFGRGDRGAVQNHWVHRFRNRIDHPSRALKAEEALES